MTQGIVRVLLHPDGKRRVLIVRRETGLFGFEEEQFSDHPDEMCWVSCSRKHYSICDSAETAEKEARGDIKWLVLVP